MSNNSPKIVIIDYGMGNLRSVQKKFNKVNVNIEVSNDPNTIFEADKLILPGVGHFANGIEKLKEYGIWDTLNRKVLIDKTPILGICLGMQLMAKQSEEGNVKGLGWFDAEIIKFRVNDKLKYKVPHMGWNNILINKESYILKGVSETNMFYFVHSFHINCNNKEDILTTTKYEYNFTSSIKKNNIYGTQFHPEKSHDCGQQILSNFVNL
ncbi:MAG: imidazole glycerol phosphate synthase subunit HisH [Candidatus Marinimicrobia bacterium]|nr:imidazole glycerol phosphate synthase subunit HisH [Candidatus Neomarinimicrobiota bacterium]